MTVRFTLRSQSKAARVFVESVEFTELVYLQQRLPYVPELRQVIKVAREFNNRAGDNLGGILIIELKAFSPHCDPDDELEQAVVSAAVSEVRKAKMIPRELDISGLQLLTPAQIAAITGGSGALAWLARVHRFRRQRSRLEVLLLAGRRCHL
jgi:hypothetical protein